MDRYILAGRHRHGTGHQPGDPGHEDIAVTRPGGCDTQHQAGRRHDAIVRAQHRGAQPADAIGAMAFGVAVQ
jgi:hypothetical protein